MIIAMATHPDADTRAKRRVPNWRNAVVKLLPSSPEDELAARSIERVPPDQANLLRGRKAHVNLIPWNDVTGLTYRRPTDDDLNGLIATLQKYGISVKVRKRKGSEIDAACGQLRRETAAKSP